MDGVKYRHNESESVIFNKILCLQKKEYVGDVCLVIFAHWDTVTGTQETRAGNEVYPKVREDLTIREKAPTMDFSWLKVPTSAFTFRTLLRQLRHYAKPLTLTQTHSKQ